ncbi:hypothetical protein DM02DRAFT_616833 [Periconia macrospinosa]|uniref:Uncharacterized protein n=1 Tax=Periconia macrospinosa TaxID=97972 RepID=A0A2V1DG84_9PLEO|nr:hypothetical protein DM02DRAFT_616833 [Periconia macrospinosa]
MGYTYPGMGADYKRFNNDYNLPPDEQVQPMLAGIESNLNQTNTTTAILAMSNIVESFLATPTCTPTAASRASNLPASITKACTSQPASFTPTTTAPISSYAACTDYASILRSCASATPSFHSLPASQQASCACYSLQTTTTACAGGSKTYVAPALATARFDNAAGTCYSYVKVLGYEKLAAEMDGKSARNQTRVGFGFCGNVDEESKSGLRAQLERVEERACEVSGAERSVVRVWGGVGVVWLGVLGFWLVVVG